MNPKIGVNSEWIGHLDHTVFVEQNNNCSFSKVLGFTYLPVIFR